VKIVERLKRLTPKQWAVGAVGIGAAALAVDYARSRDASIIARLWRSMHGGGSVPPPGAHGVVQPMPSQLPASAVFIESSMPPEVWAPMYGGVPYFAHYYTPHGSAHHHRAGAPSGVKGNVPPPGSFGIVAVTPPASTDPGQRGPQQAPCGAGLVYDPQSNSCVPYPTTPPWA
jgi:hypothetical protein